MGARGMAWSQLERWKRHQGLVAEGRGAKRLHAQFHAAHYQWMGGADMRGTQAEGACLDRRFQMTGNQRIHLLIVIQFICTHIYHHLTLVWYHIVLCAGMYHGVGPR